jgi:hypothetical protein
VSLQRLDATVASPQTVAHPIKTCSILPREQKTKFDLKCMGEQIINDDDNNDM